MAEYYDKINTPPLSMAGAMKQSFFNPNKTAPPFIDTNPKEFANPENIEDTIRETCSELAEILIRKRHDYGAGNISEFGQLGVLVRLSDKYKRLKNLILDKSVHEFEPVQDSWLDAAGYSIIGLLVSKGKW